MNLSPATGDVLRLTDEDVIRRVLAGEVDLFALLMRRHNRLVFRAARSIVKDDVEAEDVMQDAYVRAFTHLASFQERAKFSTWLTRIAVHEALARVRRSRRFELLDDADLEREGHNTMSARGEHPEQHAVDAEMTALVERAVDALPDGFRVVFMLRAVEELSTAETAESLGIPEETVRTRLHRARAHIQREIAARVDEAASSAFSFHLSRCDRVVAAVLARIATRVGR